MQTLYCSPPQRLGRKMKISWSCFHNISANTGINARFNGVYIMLYDDLTLKNMEELKVITKEMEKSIMIKSIIENSENPTAETVYKDLKLIDDLLLLQKQRMLFMPKRTKSGALRKDVTLKKVLEKRIEVEIFGSIS